MAANADDVWRTTSGYMRVFAESGATLIIINLARLRLIDAAGTELMLRVGRRARELGIAVLFTPPPANVQHVLRLTAIDRLLLEGAQ
jgi:ABC-type transporter Mla MlaB component